MIDKINYELNTHHVHFHLSPELYQDTRLLSCDAVALKHIQDRLCRCWMHVNPRWGVQEVDALNWQDQHSF